MFIQDVHDQVLVENVLNMLMPLPHVFWSCLQRWVQKKFMLFIVPFLSRNFVSTLRDVVNVYFFTFERYVFHSRRFFFPIYAIFVAGLVKSTTIFAVLYTTQRRCAYKLTTQSSSSSFYGSRFECGSRSCCF